MKQVEHKLDDWTFHQVYLIILEHITLSFYHYMRRELSNDLIEEILDIGYGVDL